MWNRDAHWAEALFMFDCAIIGGGVVGLAAAMMLGRRQPGIKLVVLEKEPDLALHQTGRNSGVIHSGIYYKPGSFKARFAREGNRTMVEFCRETRDSARCLRESHRRDSEGGAAAARESLSAAGLENGLRSPKLSPRRGAGNRAACPMPGRDQGAFHWHREFPRRLPEICRDNPATGRTDQDSEPS